jgi:hypothetical protein
LVAKNKIQENREFAQFLENNELKFGYATFWNSIYNSFFSDFDVEIASVGILEVETGIYIFPHNWLIPKYYFKENYHIGKTFILFTDEELSQLNDNFPQNYIEHLYIEGKNIFVYDHNVITELKQIEKDYEKDFFI